MPDQEEAAATHLPRHRTLRMELSPLERTRLWVEIVAFLAAGIWGVYTFVYQTQIAPLLEPAHEIVTGNMTPIGSSGSAQVERVQVTVLNDGHVPIDTAGLVINVYGLAGFRAMDISKLKLSDAMASEQFATLGHWRLLATDGQLHGAAFEGPVDSHIILSPGDSVQAQFLAAVPRGRFAALRLGVDTIFVRYPYKHRITVTVHRDSDGALSLHSPEGSSDRGFGIQSNWYFPG